MCLVEVDYKIKAQRLEHVEHDLEENGLWGAEFLQVCRI